LLVLLFQYLAVKFNFSTRVSAWDLCFGTFCLFGRKEATYLYKFLSGKFYSLCQHPNHMLTAAGVWPNCWPKANLFCWKRQSGVFRRQHTSQILFTVITAINNKWLIFASLSGVCPDCYVSSDSNIALP
jgi:hypothetical protein